MVNQVLISCPCVLEAKRNYFVAVGPLVYNEESFFLITGVTFSKFAGKKSS